MQLRDELGEVVEGAAYARILENRAENRLGVQILERVADDDLPAERLRARLEYGYRLRQALHVDERRIGDIERGQIQDQRLEVQERLKTPLTDLRLIGRVGSIPGRILKDVALNGRRHDRTVVAL